MTELSRFNRPMDSPNQVVAVSVVTPSRATLPLLVIAAATPIEPLSRLRPVWYVAAKLEIVSDGSCLPETRTYMRSAMRRSTATWPDVVAAGRRRRGRPDWRSWGRSQ